MLGTPKYILIKNILYIIDYSTLVVYPLSANPTKWSNTLKQFVGNLPAICLNVFDHFVGLAIKGLMIKILLQIQSQTFLEPCWKKVELLFSEKTVQTTRQNKHFMYL